MNRKARTTTGVRARGFAMPIVIILALVVGIFAAVLLERQAAQRLLVDRQVRSYAQHHFERGIREVVGAWTDTLAGQPLSRLIADDGHVLDLEVPGGGLAAVYMFDGQGTMLSDPRGLTAEEKDDAYGLIDALGVLTGDQADPGLFRPVGPVRVCAASAPPEILEAAVMYASGGRASGRRFVQTLVEAREKAELTQADLETAQNLAGVSAEQRPIITRILTIRPELWAMIVDVYDPAMPMPDGGPSVRYGGRLVLPVGGGARASSTLQSLGKFLSWEELPIR